MSLPAFPLSRVESVVRLSSRCILSSDCVDFTAGFCSDLLVVSVASSLLTGALRSAGAARSAAAPPAGALVAPLRAAPPAGASRVIPAPPAPPPDVAAPAPPGFCALAKPEPAISAAAATLINKRLFILVLLAMHCPPYNGIGGGMFLRKCSSIAFVMLEYTSRRVRA